MFSVKDESAQKIQAVYRGYSIRKHFLAVRLRFERIVKSIEGQTEVFWKSNALSLPIFKESNLVLRLKEIDSRKNSLLRELMQIEREIQQYNK
jgi:hypothetical protein